MTALQTVEIYDPLNDRWAYTTVTQMPSFRLDGRSVTVNNRHLWFGGRVPITTPTTAVPTTVGTTATIWEFDLVKGWSTFTTNVSMAATSIPVLIPYNF